MCLIRGDYIRVLSLCDHLAHFLLLAIEEVFNNFNHKVSYVKWFRVLDLIDSLFKHNNY